MTKSEAFAAPPAGPATPRTDAPGIVAIVPVHNGARYIARCMDGLRTAGFATRDIVVVDDGSTDDTVARCRAAGCEPLLQDNRGAAAARNAGAEAARCTDAGTRNGAAQDGGPHGHAADILFFVDADVVIAPDARTVMQAFFRDHPDHAAVFGAYDAHPAAAGRVSRIRNLLHRHVHLEGAGPAVTFWTGCGGVRRADFEAMDGFDVRIGMMEDVEFGMRLHGAGRPIHLLHTLQGKHLKHWSLLGMCRTDLLHRAIPWARLLTRQARGSQTATLNIGARGKVSVLSVATTLLALVPMFFAPASGAILFLAAFAALIIANGAFLRSLWRDQGRLDAVAAVPVLWLHYMCGGVGYAWVRATNAIGRGDGTGVRVSG